MAKHSLLLFALLAAFVAPATAERIAPEFDLESLSPAAGWQADEKITVTGDFTDDRGFREIEYRIRGKKGWKKASFITEGTASSGTVTATFTLNLKLQRKKYTRLEIRAIDVDGGESDYITRRFRWDRDGFVIPKESTADTNTDTNTDTTTDTGGTNNPTNNGGRNGNTNTNDGSTTGELAINSFNATPSFVTFVGNVTLSWDVSGASAVTIDNGIGQVEVSGSTQVQAVSQSTTWTLTAVSSGGAQQSTTVAVEVGGFIPGT